MRCSRDADPDVRVKIAECLGELGAIDPGRLDLSAVAKDTKPIRMYEVSQRLLARQLYLQLLLIGACVSLVLLPHNCFHVPTMEWDNSSCITVECSVCLSFPSLSPSVHPPRLMIPAVGLPSTFSRSWRVPFSQQQTPEARIAVPLPSKRSCWSSSVPLQMRPGGEGRGAESETGLAC